MVPQQKAFPAVVPSHTQRIARTDGRRTDHLFMPSPPSTLYVLLLSAVLPVQPTLTTPTAAAAAADPRPLHQRVWEVEREREHKLRLLLAEKEEREGATFAPPPLGRVSEKLAARDSTSTVAGGRGGEGEVLGPDGGRRLATRLQEQAMWARERRRLRIQEHEEVRIF